MGKIRTVKPGFFTSRSLARCPIRAMVTFAGLWSEADDHGRGIADPRILKGAVWPLRDDVSAADVQDDLDVLAQTGHIILYSIAGEAYFAIVSFGKHQSA